MQQQLQALRNEVVELRTIVQELRLQVSQLSDFVGYTGNIPGEPVVDEADTVRSVISWESDRLAILLLLPALFRGKSVRVSVNKWEDFWTTNCVVTFVVIQVETPFL